ncbi:hypothetical protein [Aquimarina celericrescens]|uniref:Polymerase nucleotidyl transferase domain-containing protein n=1 Tax=Aquimarina celericrescens TaxID=1964542 RepID=A0ABW5B1A4_9FLAO|nr:hypothetical protein [Aquimarina celericrescens]
MLNMIVNKTYGQSLNSVFERLSYVGHEIVEMPPDWKNSKENIYTLIFVDKELCSKDYNFFFKKAATLQIKNPRIFTTRIIGYASLFHPNFFYSLTRGTASTKLLSDYISNVRHKEINITISKSLGIGTSRYYLQSLIFLSGVTLSAAIIQNRWSLGTIESKLNRLWQAGQMIKSMGLDGIDSEDIKSFVLQTSQYIKTQPKIALKQIKYFYSKLLSVLMRDVKAERKLIKERKLNSKEEERFGFISNLKKILGTNLKSILLYGSATNSENFSDYDLIIVVGNLDKALIELDGKSPTYNNKELNIGLYDNHDFWIYQLASGDNLYDHAICLYGDIIVPHKKKENLLLRNFSFGFIRFRQLMGMGAHVQSITTQNDDKRNLLDYFIKIPLNIAKGIDGCIGNVRSNESIKAWARTRLNFNLEYLKQLSRDGDHTLAISYSTWAAQEILHIYDYQLNVTKTIKAKPLKFNQCKH